MLVTGATGGVGQFAVQLARAAGAHVTAQVSSPERDKGARALGAHEVVVDPDDGDLEPFDLVLDGVGGPVLKAAVHRLAAGATVATYGAGGGPAELWFADFPRIAPAPKLIGFFHSFPEETKGEDLAVLVGLIAEGKLVPLLGLVRDWEHTVEAIDALRNRQVRGKAVLTRV